MRKGETITIRGELHLRLETVARCYAVEVRWLERVCELGLVETTEPPDEGPALPARALDRLAEIVRLHRQLGVDLELIEAWLREA